MQVMGQEPRPMASIRAYYIGQLGKYVPGKAMVVILRAALVRSDRVKSSVAAVCVFIETISMMAVGSLLAAVVLTVWTVSDRQHVGMMAATIGFAVAASLPILPPVFRAIVRRLGMARVPADTIALLDRLNWRTVLAGYAGLSIGWVLQSWALAAVLVSIGIEDLNPLGQLPLFLVAWTTSVVAGFLSFLPGGLVVREAVQLSVLQYVGLSSAEALLAPLFSRLVSVVSEIVISGILYLFARSKVRTQWKSAALNSNGPNT
jgi:uncharacterized membrane protein YbhN (UPF0104 family)